jgi:hypothetical protein
VRLQKMTPRADEMRREQEAEARRVEALRNSGMPTPPDTESSRLLNRSEISSL